MLEIYIVMTIALLVFVGVYFYRTFFAKRPWQVKVRFRVRAPQESIFAALTTLPDNNAFDAFQVACGGVKIEAKAEPNRLQYSAGVPFIQGGSIELTPIEDTEAVELIWRQWGELDDSTSRRMFTGQFKRRQELVIQQALARLVQVLENQ